MSTVHFDIAIIGGGIMGLSTLYHLTRRNRLKVALFEQNRIASGSTQKSGGFVRVFHHNKQDLLWAYETLQFLAENQHETGLHQIGCHYILDHTLNTDIEEALNLMRELGVLFEVRNTLQIKTAIPQFNSDVAQKAIFEPNAGYADPLRTALFYAARAKATGAMLFEGAKVTNIEHDKTFHLHTTETCFTASKISLNLGAWARDFMTSICHASNTFKKGIQADTFLYEDGVFPKGCVLDEHSDMYMRNDGHNHQLVGISTKNYDVSLELNSGADAEQRQHCLSQLNNIIKVPSQAICHTGGRVGFDGYSPDGRGTVAMSDMIPGLCINSGWSGAGFKLAHGAGKTAASLLTGS